MSSRSVFLALVCLFLCFSPGQFVFAAPGDPDVSFGPGTEGGYNSAPAGYPPIGCAVQADGKVLVAGRGYTGEIAVARYLPNGFLDESFGVQGRALASGSNLYPMGMRLQADGKTLVLAEDFSSLQKPWLIRFDTDGKLDPTFGSGGKISFQSANLSPWLAEAFDLQPNGKIVVLGENGSASETLRFHPDGTADLSFGVNGVAEVSLTGAEGTGGAGFVRSLPDGRLLVAGQIGSDVVVARLQADGAPDATFPNGIGIANSFISALILMPDGRFLVAGASAAGGYFRDGMIARFDANGALDTTFGSAGVARLSVVEDPGAFENIREIALSPSGKIVVKGFSQLSSYGARFLPDGGLDEAFGENGIQTSHFGAYFAHGLQVLPDDSICVAGTPQGGFGLSKIDALGSLDTTFAGGAQVVEELGTWTYPATNFEVQVLSDGRIYSGYALSEINERRMFRHLPDGTLDATFGNGGRAVFPATGTISFSHEGEIYLGGSTGSTAVDGFSVKRYLPDGTLDVSFGNSGEARAIFPNGASSVQALLLGADGKIVAIGTCENGTAVGVARFRSDGQLDTNFSRDGMATMPALAPDAKLAGVLQEDGKIVVSQADSSGVILNRWHANGAADTSYGEGGKVTAHLGEVNRMLVRVAPGGKILLALHRFGQPVTIKRYLATGMPDSTFGNGGVVATERIPEAGLTDIEVERDGKIVLLSWDGINLARFTEAGEVDATFGVGGQSTVTLDGQSYRAGAIALGPTGKIVVCGDSDTFDPNRVTFSFIAQVEGDAFSAPAQPQLSFAQISGETVPGEASETRYMAFNESGLGAVAGWVQEAGARVPVIFGPLGNVLVRKGTRLPQIGSDASIARFRDPQGGAVVVNLQPGKGGVNSANAEVLLTGLSHGTLEVAARAGTPLPGLPEGVTIRKFLAFAEGADQPVFLAALAGSGVTAANRVALCTVPSLGGIRILARTGWTWNDRRVRSLTTLVPALGSRAHDRWRAGNAILARLSFFPGGEAVVRIPLDAAGPADWVAMFQSGPDHGIAELAGATVQRFGLPDLASDGAAVVCATVTQGGKTTTAILRNAHGNQTVLARSGDPVPQNANKEPWLSVTARRFGDPLIGANGQIAFQVTLSNGAAGIGYSADGEDWALLANAGGTAPGGGTWSAFDSLVVPKKGTAGPIFTGRLSKNSLAGVDQTNSAGLCALTSWNSLRQLLRSGDTRYGASIRSFTALNPRAANGTGFGIEATVPALARLTDGRQVRLEISVP